LSDTERANARRIWIDARPIVIGRASDCHVVVDDPEVADRHLRITVDPDGSIYVENLAAAADVDGAPLGTHSTLLVGEGRPIRIGGTIVKVRMQGAAVVATNEPGRPPTNRPSRPPSEVPVSMPDPAGWEVPIVSMPANPPAVRVISNPPVPALRRPAVRVRPRKAVLSPDPTEQDFLVQLRAQPGDASIRMVYADWLEERGLKAKMELVKLREYLDTFIHKNACDLDWRVVAVRTPIEHCGMNKCPKHWDALAPVAQSEFARHCGQCDKHVMFCAELAEVRAAAFDDRPVVFDIALDRVAAHSAYRHFGEEPVEQAPDEDYDLEDDPDGFTIDSPPTNYKR
jgi:uncharacterized protein (TIGR02996 family)